MRKTELGFRPIWEINQVSSPPWMTSKGEYLGSWWRFEKEDGVYYNSYWKISREKSLDWNSKFIKNYLIKTVNRKKDLSLDLSSINSFKNKEFFRPSNIWKIKKRKNSKI